VIKENTINPAGIDRGERTYNSRRLTDWHLSGPVPSYIRRLYEWRLAVMVGKWPCIRNRAGSPPGGAGLPADSTYFVSQHAEAGPFSGTAVCGF